mgnify:CR=1 FL=1
MKNSEEFLILVFLTLAGLLICFVLFGAWITLERAIHEIFREFVRRRKERRFFHEMSRELQVHHQRQRCNRLPPCYEKVVAKDKRVVDVCLPSYEEAIAMVPLYVLKIENENG